MAFSTNEKNISSESQLQSLGLNINKLETDLKQAVRREERHWKENDAKIRAVTQRVATYDEFRGIVDGCELQPLKSKESIEFPKGLTGWAPVLKSIQHTPALTAHEPSKTAIMLGRCETPDQFLKQWRYLDGGNGTGESQLEGQYANLLLTQPVSLLKDLFTSGRGLQILSQAISSMLWMTENTDDRMDRVLELIWGISTTEGFDLTAMFLTDQEKAATIKIVDHLEKTISDSLTRSKLVGFSFDRLRKNWCLRLLPS